MFLRLLFLLFHSLAKAALAPWDGPALAMLTCQSALLEHESALWGHWKAGTEEATAKSHSGTGPPVPQSPPVCLPLAWLGVPVVSCCWLGSSVAQRRAKRKGTAACIGESHVVMVSVLP